MFFLVKSPLNWGYGNFSHRNTRVTKLWSHDHIYNIIWITREDFVVDVMDKSYDVITFISKLEIMYECMKMQSISFFFLI